MMAVASSPTLSTLRQLSSSHGNLVGGIRQEFSTVVQHVVRAPTHLLFSHPLYIAQRTHLRLSALPFPENPEEGAKDAIVKALPLAEVPALIASERVRTVIDWINAWIKGLQRNSVKVRGVCTDTSGIPASRVVAFIPADHPHFAIAHRGPERFHVTFSWITDGSAYGIYALKSGQQPDQPPTFDTILNNTNENRVWSHIPPHQTYLENLFPSRVIHIINQYMMIHRSALNMLTFQLIDVDAPRRISKGAVLASSAGSGSSSTRGGGPSTIVQGPQVDVEYSQERIDAKLVIDRKTFEFAQFTIYSLSEEDLATQAAFNKTIDAAKSWMARKDAALSSPL